MNSKADYLLNSLSIKSIVLAFIFLAPAVLKSQFRETSGEFGISAFSSYRSLVNTGKSSTTQSAINTRNDNERPIISYGAQFNFRLPLMARLYLLAGFSYNRRGFKYETDVNASEVALLVQKGFVDSSALDNIPDKIRTTYLYHTVSMPVQVAYSLPVMNMFSLFGAVGASVDLLFDRNKNVNYYYQNNREVKRIDFSEGSYKKFNFSYRWAIGIQKLINDRDCIKLEFSYQNNIRPFNSDPVGEKLNQKGVALIYSFMLS